MAYDIGPRIKISGEKEFNQQINRINNSLKEYGSELKAVSSEYEDNARSQEALLKKNEILQKQYDAQKQKLKLYHDQLEKQQKLLIEQADKVENLTKEFGENSKEVNNAKTAYANTESNISKLKTSINETTSFTNRLSNEINKNKKELEEMAQGSRDAKTGLSNLGDESKDISEQLDDTKDSVDDLNEAFKEAFAVSELSDAASELVDNLKGVVDESKEYIKIMGALENSSALAGYSAKETTSTYKMLYGVLADDQTAATTTANLQALGLTQEQLTELTKGTIGAWTKYGDSIPIDGLAEAINETVKVGSVTGTFADVLNWAGTSEDEFNKKLEKCKTDADRANLILQELSRQGLTQSYDGFVKNNKAMIANNKAQSDMQDALADLGETMMPVFTEMTNALTYIIELFNGLPSEVQYFVLAIVGLIAVIGMLSPIITAVTNLLSLYGAGSTAAAAGTTAAGAAATGASVGFGALSSSLLPIIGIIAAVIAAIVLIVAAVKNWDKIVSWFSNNWKKFTDGLGTAFSGAKSKIQNITSSIKKIISGLSSKFPNWGKDMISGLIKGINAMVSKVRNAVKNVANVITSFLHFSRPDEGPLRNYEEWMPDMMKGLANGISKNEWRVNEEINGLANKMQYALNGNYSINATPTSGNIIVNVNTTLDGRNIAKSTEKYITKGQNAKNLAKGY